MLANNNEKVTENIICVTCLVSRVDWGWLPCISLKDYTVSCKRVMHILPRFSEKILQDKHSSFMILKRLGVGLQNFYKAAVHL